MESERERARTPRDISSLPILAVRSVLRTLVPARLLHFDSPRHLPPAPLAADFAPECGRDHPPPLPLAAPAAAASRSHARPPAIRFSQSKLGGEISRRRKKKREGEGEREIWNSRARRDDCFSALVGFLSSYRNSIDTKTNFIPRLIGRDGERAS